MPAAGHTAHFEASRSKGVSVRIPNQLNCFPKWGCTVCKKHTRVVTAFPSSKERKLLNNVPPVRVTARSCYKGRTKCGIAGGGKCHWNLVESAGLVLLWSHWDVPSFARWRFIKHSDANRMEEGWISELSCARCWTAACNVIAVIWVCHQFLLCSNSLSQRHPVSELFTITSYTDFLSQVWLIAQLLEQNWSACLGVWLLAYFLHCYQYLLQTLPSLRGSFFGKHVSVGVKTVRIH